MLLTERLRFAAQLLAKGSHSVTGAVFTNVGYPDGCQSVIFIYLGHYRLGQKVAFQMCPIGVLNQKPGTTGDSKQQRVAGTSPESQPANTRGLNDSRRIQLWHDLPPAARSGYLNENQPSLPVDIKADIIGFQVGKETAFFREWSDLNIKLIFLHLIKTPTGQYRLDRG